MGLADDFASPPPRRGPALCRVAVIIGSLTGDAQASVAAAIDNPAWPATAIERKLADNGIYVSNPVIGRHRARKCVCFRDAR